MNQLELWDSRQDKLALDEESSFILVLVYEEKKNLPRRV